MRTGHRRPLSSKVDRLLSHLRTDRSWPRPGLHGSRRKPTLETMAQLAKVGFSSLSRTHAAGQDPTLAMDCFQGVLGFHARRTASGAARICASAILELDQEVLRTSTAAWIYGPCCACPTPPACRFPASPLREWKRPSDARSPSANRPRDGPSKINTDI